MCTPGDKDILLSLTPRRGLVRKLTGWGPRAGSVALGVGGDRTGLPAVVALVEGRVVGRPRLGT